MKIGVFDSGIGGLKIAKMVREASFDLSLYYVSDYEYSPYGRLTLEKIIERSVRCTELLIERGVECIVIACNTATAASIAHLRDQFKHIIFIGVEPDINFVNRGNLKIDNCLVMTTPSTSLSKKFKRLISKRDPLEQMTYLTFPKLASLIEDLYRSEDKTLVYEKINLELNGQIKEKFFSHVVLGCTHYGLIENYLAKFFGAKMICPAGAIVDRLLELTNIKNNKFPIRHSLFRNNGE